MPRPGKALPGPATAFTTAEHRDSSTRVASHGTQANEPLENRRHSHIPRAVLDASDHRIIELLSHDGRLSNRALAAGTGLTQATVASRIRTLSERRILWITAVLDWQTAGYDWDVWLEVEVEVGTRSLAEVGDALAALPGIHSVQAVFGPVDLVVHALMSDRSEALQFMTEQLTAVPAVRRARPNVVLETVKYSVQYARVPVSAGALLLPAPHVDLDDLDRRVIHALLRDGRQSSRAIGRQLHVSEGTIRARRRHFEDAGLLRIVGYSDPYLTRLVNAWAFIGVDVEGGTVTSVSEQLAAMAEVLTVAIVAGRHDLLVAVAAVSRTRLVELVVEDIRSIAGVQATETWEVARTFRFNYQWARLV